jgi:hypothetical protein
MVNVLRFDESLQIIFENFGEVVLEFRTSKVFQNFLPIWWILSIALNLKLVLWT